MKKITEVTRQDILDIIRDGFVVEYDSPIWDVKSGDLISTENVRMWFAGRLDTIPFFSRIYDLENMPSYDRRFPNAKDDISCHLSWGDYPDDYWFLDDERFQLSRYDADEPLLRLICEMFHPAVRSESSPWKQYLQKFNELLQSDGYEIYPAESVSGRAIYCFRELDQIELPHNTTPVFAAKRALGEGSYARTFRYTDPFYNKDFVVKTAKSDLTEKELERFRREFDQMKQLRSPYIVEVYSFLPESNEYTILDVFQIGNRDMDRISQFSH